MQRYCAHTLNKKAKTCYVWKLIRETKVSCKEKLKITAKILSQDKTAEWVSI
jgi:hypothetical protein